MYAQYNNVPLNEKITEKLVEYLLNTDYGQFTGSVITKAKQCFLDWLGSALAGSKEKAAKIIVDLIDEEGGVEESTIINHKRKNSCLNASLANGAMSHILELDDLHRGASYHPAAAIIPAALAIAEKEKVDGKTFITAIILGYEASIRIGEAVGPSHYKYWHTTGTCGNFGSCVAAGKILQLSEEEMLNALGNAGTQAAGLWEFLVDGAMSKHLHPAKAAQNGLLSGILAKKGFTGAKRILEGEKGFCKVTSRDCDFNKITEGLGKDYKILEVSFKSYSSCGHTHSAIDAAKEIVKKYNLNYHKIAKIILHTYSIAVGIVGRTGSFSPETPQQAKFSLPYCTAVALKYGRVGLNEFTEEKLEDGDIKDLMGSVQLQVDDTLDSLYPQKWPCIMEVKTKDGKRFRCRVDFPKGDPDNPLSEEEIEVKFKELASMVLPDKKTKDIVRAMADLEKVKDISDFLSLL